MAAEEISTFLNDNLASKYSDTTNGLTHRRPSARLGPLIRFYFFFHLQLLDIGTLHPVVLRPSRLLRRGLLDRRFRLTYQRTLLLPDLTPRTCSRSWIDDAYLFRLLASGTLTER